LSHLKIDRRLLKKGSDPLSAGVIHPERRYPKVDKGSDPFFSSLDRSSHPGDGDG
jgi:hypothetical protein